MKATLRNIVSWTAWPGLLLLCLIATAIGFALGAPVIGFNITYFSLAVILLLLERWMPHEVAWTRADGQLGADILHTLVSKGAVQTLIVFSSAVGLAALITPLAAPGNGIWPRHWPLWAQVMLALTAAEFGLYWGHHIAHKWKPLWRFHAVHHSVKKLWVVNTGRFHFVDSIKSIVPAIAILVLLGAPLEVVTWLSAITAYIGMLTHCNVEMRFGYLSWVFNTPELHRWHHSKDLREGDKNFGENLMVWDWIFGTYFNENRRPPVDIGIKDEMPARFRDQLVWPFRRPPAIAGAAGAGARD
ncbi:MAG TPA: sterol desaturase family protein [Burkholderiales bacterium]|jgi:sterol desaturase/sphingolipid hydroxylase (fatty acid hydroxylase superfamily)|nr:sterol desaturase family protein [Burkholderiales bacterium]